MATNPLISMGVRVPDFDNSNRRVRNAHANLYEGQAKREEQRAAEEAATMEALKTYDGTTASLDGIMKVNPKAGMGIKTYESKQLQDNLAIQELQIKATKEARMAEGERLKNHASEFKLQSEKAGKLADLVDGMLKDPNFSEDMTHRTIGKALSEGLIGKDEAGQLLNQPFTGQTFQQLNDFVRDGRSAKERAAIQSEAAEAAYKAVTRPLEVKKLENEVVTGTPDPVTKLTPAQTEASIRAKEQQKFQIQKDEAQRKFTEAENQKNRSVTIRGQDMRAKGDASEADEALVKAVIADPTAFDNLTPTAKTRIIPALQAAGFDQFGKPLSTGSIDKMAETASAVASLQDLRKTLQENEQFIGPVAGFAAINPYSDARKAQAKIDLVKQRVGKALEGGVLRKEDEEKYKKILATLNDTPETAIAKVDGLITTLERDSKIYKDQQKAAGRRMPGEKKPAEGGKQEDLRKKYNY